VARHITSTVDPYQKLGEYFVTYVHMSVIWKQPSSCRYPLHTKQNNWELNYNTKCLLYK
jgi:hypothetical protein